MLTQVTEDVIDALTNNSVNYMTDEETNINNAVPVSETQEESERRLKVELTSAVVAVETNTGETATTTTTVKGATFEIKPVYVYEKDGKTMTEVVKNEDIKEPITFRLAVQKDIEDDCAKVWHQAVVYDNDGKASAAPGSHEEYLGVFPITTAENGEKYIQLSASKFSFYNYLTKSMKDMTCVAQIGEVKYETLEEAIAAVPDGGTEPTVIKMLDNVTSANGISVPSGKNFTVDFDQHTYTLGGNGAGSANTETCGFQLLKNSTITFMNGTIDCDENNKNHTWTPGSTEPKGIAMLIQNYANLTLEGMTIDGTNIAHNNVDVRYVLSNNSGTVSYTGSTTIKTVEGDVAFDVCKYGDYDVPTVTIDDKNVTINGKIEATGGKLIITNGTVDGTISTGTGYEQGDIAISGGSFKEVVKEEYCAKGFKPVTTPNSEGKYTVEKKPVAKIGTTEYTSLADAVAAVQNGGTITMIADVTGADGISVASGKNFTVDFGGKTYTLGGNGAGSAGTQTIGFQFLENSYITLKNGTINCSEANKNREWDTNASQKGIAMLIQNYANLTLDDMAIDGTNIAHNGTNTRYVVSNNSGNVKFTGKTAITAAEGDFAFDACKYSTYDAPTITIADENVTINGKIEATGGKLIITDGTVDGTISTGTGYKQGDIAISGGSFKEVVKEEYCAKGFKPGTTTNSEGKYTVEKKPVAKIGDVEYTSLADAVAAVPTDGTETTITMIADEVIVGNAGVTVAAGQNIVLDLNGKTITNNVTENKASQLITNKGTLTITGNGTMTNALADGTIAGDWPTYNYATNLITNVGTLTIENGTFKNTQDSGITYTLDNNSNGVEATATINGGTFISAGNAAVRMFCNSTTAGNNLTINGGYFEGKYYAVSVSNASGATKVGTLTITDGEFESTADEYNACIANWVSNKSSNIAVNSEGGKFNDYVLIASNGAITGGTFKYKSYTDPDDGTVYNLEDYLAEGFELVDKGNGTYGVVDVDAIVIFTINGEETKYSEGDTAIALVDAGTTELVIPADIDDVNVTYKRDFTGTSGYQAWYAPFETAATDDVTFAKILQMAYVDESGKIVADAADGILAIIVEKVSNGTVIKANVPYVVKPTTAEEKTFTATSLKKTKDTSFVINTSTTKFTFTGSYNRYEGEDGWFYLNKSGTYSKATETTTGVNAYRWHINTESTDLYGDDGSNSPASIRMFVLGEDEEATSIMQQIMTKSSSLEGNYDINGRTLNKAVRGLYIQNGKKIISK